MTAIFSLVAAGALSAGSAYAALEIDCLPELAAAHTSDGLTMDEEMLKKRKQAREAELARLKARYMARTTSDAQAASAEPARTTP